MSDSSARQGRRFGYRWRLPCALAAVLVCGCQTGRDAKPGGSPGADGTQVARSEVERGPVRLVVEAAPKRASLSDEPTLTLTIESQRGAKVRKPPFGESLGDFAIRDFREPLPEIRGDREIIRQVYTLEPMRAGRLAIQPISVTFIDGRPGGDGEEHSVESEPLAIEVTTVLGEEAPSLDDLAGLEGPVDLPRRSSAGFWLAAAGALLAGLAAAVLLWRVRRKGEAPEEIARSPQELAYLELEQLLEQGWQEKDVKLFYVGLTGIVRRYIERTTGVHAPEQTTEEFLREVGEGEVFVSGERDRLRAFLESADLVKFAAHQPGASDVEQTFRRAKAFIGLEDQETAA
jgi:hypothetical protein